MLSIMPKSPRKKVRIPTPDEIRAARKLYSLTQEKAAHRCGISRRSWVAYEKGEVKPSRPVAILIWLLMAGKLD